VIASGMWVKVSHQRQHCANATSSANDNFPDKSSVVRSLIVCIINYRYDWNST